MLERVRRKGSSLALLVGMYLIQTLWKMVWRFLKKLGIKPYDPAIPLLGIYPEETKTEKFTVPHCSLEYYLQMHECGSILDVHRQMNG